MITNKKYIVRIFPFVLLIGAGSFFAMEQGGQGKKESQVLAEECTNKLVGADEKEKLASKLASKSFWKLLTGYDNNDPDKYNVTWGPYTADEYLSEFKRRVGSMKKEDLERGEYEKSIHYLAGAYCYPCYRYLAELFPEATEDDMQVVLDDMRGVLEEYRRSRKDRVNILVACKETPSEGRTPSERILFSCKELRGRSPHERREAFMRMRNVARYRLEKVENKSEEAKREYEREYDELNQLADLFCS